MPPIASWRDRANALQTDGYALYLACRDSRVPLLPKLIAALVAAYALSPIDLIPDFIPVLGYVDDLILVPLGLAIAIRLVPPAIMAEHRAQAALSVPGSRPRSLLGAGIVVALWVAGLAWLAPVAWGLLRSAWLGLSGSAAA